MTMQPILQKCQARRLLGDEKLQVQFEVGNTHDTRVERVAPAGGYNSFGLNIES